MKITATTFLAAVLALATLATVPAWAQNDASPDTKSKTAPVTVSNEPVTTDGADDNPPPQVRIDDAGVHIGGPNPVEINAPSHGRRTGSLEGFLALMLPIISVLAVFGMPVAIVGFILYFKHRRNRMLHETLRVMVEKGVPIPAELLSGPRSTSTNVTPVESRGNKDLRAGLILIAVGIGLLMLGRMAGISRLGLIPLFIGVALLVVWLIGLIGNKRKNTLAQ